MIDVRFDYPMPLANGRIYKVFVFAPFLVRCFQQGMETSAPELIRLCTRCQLRGPVHASRLVVTR